MTEMVGRSEPPDRVQKTLTYWLEKVQALDEDHLQHLLPLMEESHAVGAMRAVIHMCPALAEPDKALGACVAHPRDEFMRHAFKLRTLAMFLERRDTAHITLDAWCRKMLESEALRDPDLATRLVQWCQDMIALLRQRSEEGNER